MILLRDTDRYKCYATLSPDGKEIIWLTSDDDPSLPSRPWDGFICEIEGDTVYFYRDNQSIFFGFNDKQYLIDDQISAKREPTQDDRVRFCLYRGPNQIFEWIYPRIELPFLWDMTHFAAEEDFDIGLRAFNIISSPERREVFRNPGV